MTKWLLILAVVGGVLWWLTRGRRGGRGGDGGRSAPGPGPGGQATPPSPDGQTPAPMVRCAHCGLMLPRSESVRGGDPVLEYCSDEHRRSGPRPS